MAAVRVRIQEDTKACVKSRTDEGNDKREIVRILKCHLARQIHPTLTSEDQQLVGNEKASSIVAWQK